MKKLGVIVFFVLMGISVVSCLDDEQTESFVYRYSPIDSVTIDTAIYIHQIAEIKTYFKTSNNCQFFYDYDYSAVGKERTVAVILAQKSNQSCDEIVSNEVRTLRFRPEKQGLYTFRFWQGKDENDEDQFIIHKLNVL